jgi:hypothetical protein
MFERWSMIGRIEEALHFLLMGIGLMENEEIEKETVGEYLDQKPENIENEFEKIMF